MLLDLVNFFRSSNRKMLIGPSALARFCEVLVKLLLDLVKIVLGLVICSARSHDT